MVAANARSFVHGPPGSFAKIEVGFGANDEEREALREGIQAAEIYVAAVHDIECSRLQNQLVEDIDVMRFSIRDADKTRDISTQVYQCVQFDGGLVFAKSRPGKQRKTKIDGGGIEGVCRLFQIDSEAFPGIQFSGDADQNLGEVGIDTPVSFLVCIGKSASRDFASNASMIKFGFLCTQTCFDISEAFPVCDLREGHAKELIETRESPGLVIASISSDAIVEISFGQEVHQLRKNDSSRVHFASLSV